MVLIAILLSIPIMIGIISFASVCPEGMREYGIKDNEGKRGWGIFLVACELLPIIIVFFAGIGVIPNKMLKWVQLMFAIEGLFFPIYSMIAISNSNAKMPPIRKLSIITITGICWFCIIKSALTAFNVYISLPRTAWVVIDFVYVFAKVILCF